MKTWILAMTMMVGMTLSAQEMHHKGQRPQPLSAEQRTELQVKKLTLALDLNDKQQSEVRQLFLDRNKKFEEAKAQFKANKEAGKKMTSDDRYAMQSKRLDDQIAMKKEMKKILTPEQFDKMEKLHKEGGKKITNRAKNFKKQHKR